MSVEVETKSEWVALPKARMTMFADPLPSHPTILWWIKKGVRGVRLECRVLGGRYYLRQSDIDKFYQETSDAMKNRQRKEVVGA